MATVEMPTGGAPLTVLNEEEQMFRDTVRQFAESEVRPRVHQMDEAQQMDPDLIPQIFELGLMAVEVPEEFGGAGASFFTAALVVEELSRVDASVGVLVDVQNTLVNNAFLRWGSEDLKARYLPQLASERVGAYALSEAGSGSDAFALTTRGVEADGGYRLTGRKLWITNGAEAEIFIIFANVNPEAGYRGITA
ncbi:MAG: acyl-CoA dehydrogenase family protein, partial [Chloroflexota bacterium]|nr:acyl-CoA dehydrogenase family protein [Chloroflexota bacterium]